MQKMYAEKKPLKNLLNSKNIFNFVPIFYSMQARCMMRYGYCENN